MSVLIFLDQSEGHIKKSSLEAASYGAKVAELLGTTADAIVLGNVADDLTTLGNYGIKKVHTVKDDTLDHVDAQVFTKIIADAAKAIDARVIIFSNNFNGKAIAPRLSVRLKAGLVSGAVALPETGKGFTVKKNVFSGKAFAHVSISTDIRIISLNPNSYSITTTGAVAEVTSFAATIDTAKVQVTSTDKVVGEIPLSEAEIVV
ncbi:MAG TPA: electron transfer flavoprotein subunit alpha/FixB family protein, partial [Ferruginibacter sp.]|nr:electron transfer flavoprotein subunit alpha/FixB family protein [Ferruginibacter sp.]